MELLTANLVGHLKRVQRNGRSYLTAPAVLVVEGTLRGSNGALYYPREELARAAHDWSDIPITVGHPKDRLGRNVAARDPAVLDRVKVGRVYNPRVDGDRLVAEAWLDEAALKRVDSRILRELEQGRPVELSTGLHTQNHPAAPGSRDAKGRPYDYIARSYAADHLALLPDEPGACSVKDGCGLLVNRAGEWVPIGNAVGASMWFARCPRDAKGRCGPAGSSGKGPKASSSRGGGSGGGAKKAGGGKKFSASSAAKSLEKDGKVKLESDDKDGGKSRAVVKREKGQWVSTHYSQMKGEEGFTRSEGFYLGSTRKMSAADALKSALKNFGKADRVVNSRVPTGGGWIPVVNVLGCGSCGDSCPKCKAATANGPGGKGKRKTCPHCGAKMKDGKCPACGAEYNAARKPSAKLDMTPAKACKILDDGTANGVPLSKKQRGMFGALCGKRDAATANGTGWFKVG